MLKLRRGDRSHRQTPSGPKNKTKNYKRERFVLRLALISLILPHLHTTPSLLHFLLQLFKPSLNLKTLVLILQRNSKNTSFFSTISFHTFLSTPRPSLFSFTLPPHFFFLHFRIPKTYLSSKAFDLSYVLTTYQLLL